MGGWVGGWVGAGVSVFSTMNPNFKIKEIFF